MIGAFKGKSSFSDDLALNAPMKLLNPTLIYFFSSSVILAIVKIWTMDPSLVYF